MDAPCTPYRALQSPKAFPTKVSASAEQQQQVLDQVLSKWLDKFETVKHDSDLAWQTFSALSEDCLRGIHKCSKIGEGGRHTKIRFRQMNCTQAAADKNYPCEVGAAQLTKHRKTQRQSKELRHKVLRIQKNVSNNRQDNFDCCNLIKALQKPAHKLGCQIRF